MLKRYGGKKPSEFDSHRLRMEKYKMHPETARSSYLSSLDNAEILQDAIDIEEQFNASREKHAEMVGLTFVNEDTGEEKHLSFKYSDEDKAASQARIAKNEERLKLVKDFIEEILDDYPEFAQE